MGELLGVPPVATYAATVIFNSKPTEQERQPEDFEIEFTFTGTEDEKWFYAISAAIDARSSSIIKIVDSILALDNYENDNDENDWFAEKLENEIKTITRILQRMYERCRPEIFYNKIRMYLSGWLNDREIGPDGLTYQLTTKTTNNNADGNEKTTFVQLKLAGGSAAQNPTIQLLDVILGVKHGNDPDNLTISEFKYCDFGDNVGGCPSRNHHVNYLNAMRTYMPKEHRDYLNELGEKLKSNSYFNKKFKSTDGYKKCLKALIEFRSEHIKMVAHYIICQTKTEERVQGTGGSNPVPFLKKCRSETEFCLLE